MTDPREFNRLADLRSANIARQKEWDSGNQLTLAYRGNELAGEVGEACNVIKKLERERLGINGSRDTVAHLAEELADVIICTDLIAMQAGIDLDTAVVAKFNASSEKVGLKTRLAAQESAKPAAGGGYVSFPRWWIEHIRDGLVAMGNLPSGPLGDWAFIFREQLTDKLDALIEQPATSSYAADVREALQLLREADTILQGRINRGLRLTKADYDRLVGLLVKEIPAALSALPAPAPAVKATVEELARELIREDGGSVTASEGWLSTVKHHNEMLAKYPDYEAGRSLTTDGFRRARSLLSRFHITPKARGQS